MKRVKSFLKRAGSYYARSLWTLYGPAIEAGAPIYL
jgi:hypothetical protein